MLIGAHVSSSGGINKACINASKLNVEIFQTFLSAPQSYKVNEPNEFIVKKFLDSKQQYNIKKCFVHAIYLLNFASDKLENINLSKQNLIKTLNISSTLKFDGVVIHLGSTKEGIEKGIKLVSEGIKEVLDQTAPDSFLYLENSSGAGNCIGSDINHLVEILNQNKANQRIKVCIDTQHLFAAGYDLKSNPIKVLDNLFGQLEDRIELVHLNDSKTEFNSKKDRHENIGEGKIGIEAFAEFCKDKRLQTKNLILEVPGFAGKGPDAKNLELVRSFIK